MVKCFSVDKQLAALSFEIGHALVDYLYSVDIGMKLIQKDCDDIKKI